MRAVQRESSSTRKNNFPKPGNHKCRAIALSRHKQNKYGKLVEFQAYSSVSLPNWNVCRLNEALNVLKNSGFQISKTDLIIGCIKAYLPKCNLKMPSNELASPIQVLRTRKQNQRNTYTYSKISTYCSTHEWDALHLKSFYLKVSFSQMVDIALRLYLRGVVAQLLEAKKPIGQFRRILSIGKYQKDVLTDNPRTLCVQYFLTHTSQYPRKRLHIRRNYP